MWKSEEKEQVEAEKLTQKSGQNRIQGRAKGDAVQVKPPTPADANKEIRQVQETDSLFFKAKEP